MIPLVHDLSEETVLVVGGGPVGARKARRFAAEAETIVVSQAFADADFGDAECVRMTVTPETATEVITRFDPAVVVTATDDSSVNDALATVAREQGVLLNRADEAGDRDAASVIVPATVREDPVSVAVTTSGRSPALSRYLREEIESEIEGAGGMATLSATIRTDLKEEGVSPATRREAIRAVVRSQAVWKALRTGETNARREASAVVKEVLEDR
jgi:precorrin-2 dehydrogenase/sirohydrochlorin ferrochelatase